MSSKQFLRGHKLMPTTIFPTWLGVIGGGQLGRMFVQAAQAMGFKVAVLEQEKNCPAGQIADLQICTTYTDQNGLHRLGSLCTAVTIEFENVSATSLLSLEKITYVSPSSANVLISQNRMFEKRFFMECVKDSDVQPAPYQIINSIIDIEMIPLNLLPGILKTVCMGYDGKGQICVNNIDDVKKAFLLMQGATCLLEKMLPLALEISVLIARGADGTTVVYPIAENVHRNGILFTTTVPSPNISNILAKKAKNAALNVISKLNYVGVLCIEFFILTDGTLVINEMAPRPHNSGHYTINACNTSQFEQQVRAMTCLPLSKVRQHSTVIMLNIFGDFWFNQKNIGLREPAWAKILALPGAHLHLYGKTLARRGRKMGHITFIAPTLRKAKIQLIKALTILIPHDDKVNH